jgi:hypothetical protein
MHCSFEHRWELSVLSSDLMYVYFLFKEQHTVVMWYQVVTYTFQFFIAKPIRCIPSNKPWAT